MRSYVEYNDVLISREAFFAMPLLNWTAGLSEHEQGLVINPRFKYYWFVTLPLTFLVLAGWTIWKGQVADLERTLSAEYISKGKSTSGEKRVPRR